MKKYLSLWLGLHVFLPAHAGTRQVLPDFFLISDAKIKAAPERDLTRCREHIRETLCLVDPTDNPDLSAPRECLAGGQDYAPLFERLYDQYPPTLQKVFCSLTQIYIEKEFYGTAYAGLLEDANRQPIGGAVVGIRKSVLDENLSLSQWASWKEQLSFGGISSSYTTLPGLPQVHSESPQATNDFLFFVIAHEFAHVLDFANNVNRVTEECVGEGDDEDCNLHPESFGAFSWESELRALPENEFTQRKNLCFYWCMEENISFFPHAEMPALYERLDTGNFISLYAMTQAWDDFAESVAFYLLDKKLKSTYLLDSGHGARYDVIQKLKSKVFRKKYDYVEDFLNRSDLAYP